MTHHQSQYNLESENAMDLFNITMENQFKKRFYFHYIGTLRGLTDKIITQILSNIF